MKVTDEVWKDLAGPLYEELLKSKKIALAHLAHPDPKVRAAAIKICDFTWRCSADIDFVTACRNLAASDPADLVRVSAISSFGKALGSSQDRSASQFLADMVIDPKSPEQVQQAAYWALREIQFGFTPEDFVKRSITPLKNVAAKKAMSTTEIENIKQAMLCGTVFPESFWDSPDQIDWKFVARYASRTQR